jgi:hypothetical protein
MNNITIVLLIIKDTCFPLLVALGDNHWIAEAFGLVLYCTLRSKIVDLDLKSLGITILKQRPKIGLDSLK